VEAAEVVEAAARSGGVVLACQADILTPEVRSVGPTLA
jgi:hypothetical protein